MEDPLILSTSMMNLIVDSCRDTCWIYPILGRSDPRACSEIPHSTSLCPAQSWNSPSNSLGTAREIIWHGHQSPLDMAWSSALSGLPSYPKQNLEFHVALLFDSRVSLHIVNTAFLHIDPHVPFTLKCGKSCQ